MKNEILNKAKENIINGIISEGDFQIVGLAPRQIEKILLELGYVANDDYDTNGWEIDWWWSFSKDDTTWNLSGSMYQDTVIYFTKNL